MGLFKISLTLVCLLELAMVHSSRAQNSKQDYLDAHNVARAEVGVGPLTWDDRMEYDAQNYANQRIGDCTSVQSTGSIDGQNITEGSDGDFSGSEAVGLWVGEKPYYDYISNSCVERVCGHYTQVVWNNSVRLGCARVRCNNGWWFVNCIYYPPGNYVGQRPYNSTAGKSTISYAFFCDST